MVNLTPTLLLALATTALGNPNPNPNLLPKRDYASVTNDLSALSQSYRTVSSAASSVSDNKPPSYTPLNAALNRLDYGVKTAITDTNNAGTLSATQSQSICEYFGNALIPLIRATLAQIVAKRRDLDDGGQGLKEYFLRRLSSESSSHVTLGAAVTGRVAAGQKGCASSASGAMVGAYGSAIVGFGAA